MKILSVNSAIKEHNAGCSTFCCVEGILSFEFEEVCIYHWPKSERAEAYSSSVWLDQQDRYRFNSDTLQKWAGKRVVVCGTLELYEESDKHIDRWHEGFGHMSLWPARILVERIEPRKNWLVNHEGDTID